MRIKTSITAAMMLLSSFAGIQTLTAADERPNVILIISDDHAFDDYGFMGSERVNTPVLDKLADESLTYTRGYVMPVCSPTLASLLTGKLPHQHGITGNDLTPKNKHVLAAIAENPAKFPDERSRHQANSLVRAPIREQLLSNSLLLPKAVSEAGYLTFQTGKIWNGSYEDMGFTAGMTAKGERHGGGGLTIGRETMQPIFDFIEKAEQAEKPFFIWHAPFLPHTPHNPPKRLYDKYRGKGPTAAAEKYFAMVEWLDESTGELEDYLVANNLKDNTVVIYVADNGWNAEKAYKGDRAKLSPYEDGIRTPIMLRWPGEVEPVMDQTTLAHVTDIPKTILHLTGAKDPGDLPGLNLMDRAEMQARNTVFAECYRHNMADLSDPGKSLVALAVIHGWWKLLIPGSATPWHRVNHRSNKPRGIELYNLKTDPYELKNVADEHPDVVKQLKALQMEQWNPYPTD